MEPKALGLDVLRESWVTRTLAKCPCFVDTQFVAIMALCFDRYLFTAINFMRAQMSELLPTQDNNLCESLTRLLDCFLEPYCDKEGRDAPKKEVVARAVAQLEARFIFSLVWSVGCTGPNESRARFDLWLRLQLAQFGMKDKFPDEGLVYDYVRARRPVSILSSLNEFGPRRGRRGASESARSRRWCEVARTDAATASRRRRMRARTPSTRDDGITQAPHGRLVPRLEVPRRPHGRRRLLRIRAVARRALRYQGVEHP